MTVLGLPPAWYKSAPYRARAVQDPRGTLAEFGTIIAKEKEIRVWDSTSEVRYLVISERPKGTENWNENKLLKLVTRNSMIGGIIVKKMLMKGSGIVRMNSARMLLGQLAAAPYMTNLMFEVER